jgi:dTDP-4-amino-4,6-dideoxygalactose transaminase
VSATLLDVWPPLPPGAYLRRRRAELPYPLEDRRCVLFARGRSGLYHGLRALGLGSGDVVLMPAYHHGSEVEAATRAGLACSFYEGDERLEPDVDELEGLLEPGVRALHITHYLGFPQDVARWRAWCDEHGLLLIEDAAQAWLARDAEGRPLGRLGDLAVFCLYKTFGVPDGAALVTREGGEVPTVRGLSARRCCAQARRLARRAFRARRKPAADAPARAPVRPGGRLRPRPGDSRPRPSELGSDPASSW